MEKEQILQLGTFQLPVSILVLIVGFIAAVYFTERLAAKKGWAKEKWSDLVISVSLAFIIVYKFGWIFFDLGRVINNPSSIIWMSGSTPAIVLAIILALVILIYKVKKNRYSYTDFLDLGWVFSVIIMLIYNLFILDYGKVTDSVFGITMDNDQSFSYHPINWYKAFLLSILLILRFTKWKDVNSNSLAKLYLLLGAGLLFISIFDLPLNLLFGFTYEQWAYIAIALAGVIGLLRKNNTNLKN